MLRQYMCFMQLISKVLSRSTLTIFLQGNVIIVDTPGISDEEQENVASIMMDYLKNALAVVFVANVANAGGIQSDRVFYYFVNFSKRILIFE